MTKLDDAIANKEKHDVSFSIWNPKVWKSGIWEHNTPLDKALEEKQK